MLTFRIDAKRCSPEVFIDRNNHIIDISGTSTLKNTSLFYSNVLKWVIAFNNDNNKPTIINIKLDKINDASSKWLMLIMNKLVALVPNQKITVNWYYQVRNSSIQLSGERLKLNSEIPVNLIAA
jgi:hypothetical protein